MAIHLQLENGNPIDVADDLRVGDLVQQLGVDDPKIIGAKINKRVFDLQTKIGESGTLAFVRKGPGEEALHLLRHTAAHVMAQAVMRLFKDVEFAIGPTIEDGFYYDFDLEHVLAPEDFPAIEDEMRKIIAENYPVVRREVSEQEAQEILGTQRATFKRELLRGLEGQQLSFYTQNDFTDLCRGPHLPSTGYIGAFKLLSVAGAYWRGKETNPMLQRIYGTAFFTEKELKAYLRQLEEAKKRDHKKLGAELDLFHFDPVGPGFPFWHANGSVVYGAVQNYMNEKLQEYDYDTIRTPLILNEQLWRDSGHWEHYRENMYFTEIDEKAYAVKPMNCPGGTRVYKHGFYSYRDLPVRQAEFGVVHRHEKSGVLSGLFRVRSFTQDDAHIYCTPDQAVDEVISCLNLVQDVYKQFGFDEYHFELSTRPDKSIGTDEQWEFAESVLHKALERIKIDYQLNPGDGAFYGPKIDVHIKDAIKRTWQCGTIQVDFSMPQRFGLEYVDADGERKQPVMIHRAIFGSLERFIGILIEHTAGKFPAWLAPVQAMVIPVSDEKFGEYAQEVRQYLHRLGLRVQTDSRNESLNKRIRDNQKKQVPYMLVVGEKEAGEGTVSVRRRDGVQLPEPLRIEEFADLLIAEVVERRLDLYIGAQQTSTN